MAEKIFTSRQVLAASVVGGPIAGAFALSKNALATGALTDAVVMLPLVGWVLAISYLIMFPYIPPVLSLGIVPIGLCLATYTAARSLSPEKWLKRRAEKWSYYDALDVVKVAGVSLIAMVAVEFAWIQALAAG